MSIGADVLKTTMPTDKCKKMPTPNFSKQLPRSLVTTKGKSDDHVTMQPNHTNLDQCDAMRNTVKYRLPQFSDPVNELSAYCQHKPSSLTDEHEQLQRRLDDIADTMKIHESSTWALHQKEMEICDLKRALSDMQVYLFQEREHVLRLYAENDRLKINQLDDRRKIQHLLQLSGLAPSEVTYFLKDTGAVISETSVLRENASPCKPKHPSGLVVAPVVPLQPAPGVVEIVASGKSISKPVSNDTSVSASLSGLTGGDFRGRSNVSRLQHESLIRELEVVRSSLRSMQTQLAEQTVLAKEQIDSLMDDRQVMQEESDAVRKNFEEKLRLCNDQLKRYQTMLYDSIKEFIAQRSQFKQAEKAWIAEKDQLMCRLNGQRLPLSVVPCCNTSGAQPSSERSVKPATTCFDDDLVSAASGGVASQSTRKRYEQLVQTTRDLQHQLSQQQKLSEMYREQVRKLKEELVRSREGCFSVENSYKDYSVKLNERLQMMTNRCQNLARRRQLELQGYRTDIAALKKKLKEVEKQLQTVTLGSADTVDAPELRDDADIAILKQVKSSTLKSTQLMNELKNLKLMMYRIEDDIRKI